MGLWGKLVKSVDVWGEGDTTFVALLKKWNEIFKRTDVSQHYWQVIKPQENPSTLEEACSIIIAEDFSIKFWQDTYQGLGWSDEEWCTHSHKFKCKDLNWYSAYYQIHIEYSAKGMTLTLDYITGDEDDEDDYEESCLRLSFYTADGSISKVASATGETEHSDGVYPTDMFKAMEKPKTGERVKQFLLCMNKVASSSDVYKRMKEREKIAEEEHKQRLDDAFGDL